MAGCCEGGASAATPGMGKTKPQTQRAPSMKESMLTGEMEERSMRMSQAIPDEYKREEVVRVSCERHLFARLWYGREFVSNGLINSGL